jgi:hypothetical protein
VIDKNVPTAPVARANVLLTIAQLVALANAVAPDVAQIIAVLRSSTATMETLLADADTTERAEIAKLQAELAVKGIIVQ